MKTKILCLFLAVPWLLKADPSSQMQEASVYAEAGRLDRAQAIYRALLDEPLTAPQRNTITYNLGVTLMEQRRWEEAIKLFYELAPTAQDSPLLRYRYHYNLAVALLAYTEEREGTYSTDDPAFIDRFKWLKAVIQLARQELNEADRAYCVLLSAKGVPTCTLPTISATFQAKIKQLTASLNDQKNSYYLAQLSADAKLARLWVVIDEIIGELQAYASQDPLWNHYAADQLSQLKTTWDSLLSDKFVHEAQEKTIHAALAYRQAERSLQQDSTANAIQSLKSSLDDLMAALKMNQGTENSLSNLAVDYTIALAYNQLSTDRIAPFTARLEQLVKEAPSDAALAWALSQHTEGIKALDAGQPTIARIFLTSADHTLLKATQERTLNSQSTSEQRLANLLQDQAHALQIVAAVMDLPPEDRQSSSPFAVPLHDAMRRSQGRYESQIAPLVASVLQTQKRAFKGDGPQHESCQSRPWGEVMPLVFLGESAAARASELLAEPKSSLSTVFDYQKVAYRKWLKAIELLQENATSSSRELSPPPPSSPSRTWWTDDSQRLLLQMNREDKEKSASQQPTSLPPGGKPW